MLTWLQCLGSAARASPSCGRHACAPPATRTARSDCCAASGAMPQRLCMSMPALSATRMQGRPRRSRSDLPAARVRLRHLHTVLQSFLRRPLLRYHRLEIALVLHTIVEVGANLLARGYERSRKGRFPCRCSSEQCTYRPRTSPFRDARTKPTMPRKLFFAPARNEEIEKNRVDFFAL